MSLYSVAAGRDIFLQKQIKLDLIVKFICCWLDNLPLKFIRKNTRIAQETAVDFSSFCRELIYDHMINKWVPLGCPGKVVEIDESKLGRRKYNRDHYVEGQWLFRGIWERIW